MPVFGAQMDTSGPWEDLPLEELLRRCIEYLHGLNEEEIKTSIATGHKVVIVDSENFQWVRNALTCLLEQIEQIEDL